MQRYKLTIEYHGAGYVGWQHQDGCISVQRTMEQAIHKLWPESERPVLCVAGRTDAGVHARGQVAHVDLPAKFTCFKLQQALNFHLKGTRISIVDIIEVEAGFHARFSASKRRYCYRLINRRSPLALEGGLAWQVYQDMDLEAFKAGAKQFVGHHDFTSFRASACQAKSPIRTLERFDIEVQENLILCHIEARSFLHHQVRNMVGALKYVGIGKWSPDKISELLALKNRCESGPTAPAAGLYLMSVTY